MSLVRDTGRADDDAVEVARKKIHIKHVGLLVGVHSRNYGNTRIYPLGWKAIAFLKGLS